MFIHEIDDHIISLARKYAEPFYRLALFVIYFWFGLLKAIEVSPASGLVRDLLVHTMPFISPELFMLLLGLFEMMIGVLFLIRGAERVVIPLLIIHMITTLIPLVVLPEVVWQDFLIPTLEGQYIIKNLALIGLAIGIVCGLKPLRAHRD